MLYKIQPAGFAPGTDTVVITYDAQNPRTILAEDCNRCGALVPVDARMRAKHEHHHISLGQAKPLWSWSN